MNAKGGYENETLIEAAFFALDSDEHAACRVFLKKGIDINQFPMRELLLNHSSGPSMKQFIIDVVRHVFLLIVMGSFVN